MKLRSLAFVLVLLPALVQQECDLQKALQGDIDQTIESELVGKVREYFPKAKWERLEDAQLEAIPVLKHMILIDTGITGVSKKFVEKLGPQLYEEGLHKLAKERRAWYGGFIPYTTVVFSFNDDQRTYETEKETLWLVYSTETDAIYVLTQQEFLNWMAKML